MHLDFGDLQLRLGGQMILAASSYWNIGIGKNPGEVLNDQEGVKTMKDLGTNMAWLIGKIKE